MRSHTRLMLGVLLAGCASGVDEGATVDSVSNLISFSPMYSAFDGVHEYALTPNVPSAAWSEDEDPVLASSIAWQLDSAFVKRDEFPDLPAAIKLTTKKPGATTVAITAKTLSGRAVRSETRLIISRANQSEREAGEARYDNGEITPSQRPTVFADDLQCPGGPGGLDIPRASACGNCHSVTSTIAFEPTPTQTAGYSNEDLIKIFTEGERPTDRPFKGSFLRQVPMPLCIYKEFHTWNMSDDEKNGIIWKLRSIPPMVLEEE